MQYDGFGVRRGGWSTLKSDEQEKRNNVLTGTHHALGIRLADRRAKGRPVKVLQVIFGDIGAHRVAREPLVAGRPAVYTVCVVVLQGDRDLHESCLAAVPLLEPLGPGLPQLTH